MPRSYYKIPAEFIVRLGLTDQLVPFPDGRYLCTEVVLARIHRDPEKALEITGGIRITLEQARDEQMGLTVNPLPGDPAPADPDAPLYADDVDVTPQEGGAE